ncbi:MULTISPECIES: hypothetical protein [unclassified Calothrix]|nr:MULTISPECIES: hypothetical protein [unclassified Calothrix]
MSSTAIALSSTTKKERSPLNLSVMNYYSAALAFTSAFLAVS